VLQLGNGKKMQQIKNERFLVLIRMELAHLGNQILHLKSGLNTTHQLRNVMI
jgi:hypothetical protein